MNELKSAVSRLTAAKVPSPQNDALTLAAYACQMSKTDFVRARILGRVTLPAHFDELVSRRVAREPLQHITGTAPTADIELAVGPGVFIPRPETDTVAAQAIAKAQALGARRIVDLGCGSGVLAIALARQLPKAQVWAVERDETAAQWARRNFSTWASHVELIIADVAVALRDLNATMDMVVANPPYVPACEVEPEVQADPPAAVFGGGGAGMDAPKVFLAAAARLLRSGGVVVLEHDETQAEEIAAAAMGVGFTHTETLPDLTGRPRMVIGVRV